MQVTQQEMADIEELVMITGASKLNCAQYYKSCGGDKNSAVNLILADMEDRRLQQALVQSQQPPSNPPVPQNPSPVQPANPGNGGANAPNAQPQQAQNQQQPGGNGPNAPDNAQGGNNDN